MTTAGPALADPSGPPDTRPPTRPSSPPPPKETLAEISSGRDGKAAPGGSRPVQPRAGEPPLPGAAFRLPLIPTVPSFDNGPDFSTGVALL